MSEPNLVDLPNMHARFIRLVERADTAEREAARLRAENEALRDLLGEAGESLDTYLEDLQLQAKNPGAFVPEEELDAIRDLVERIEAKLGEKR
jgi:hypothetical protein